MPKYVIFLKGCGETFGLFPTFEISKRARNLEKLWFVHSFPYLITSRSTAMMATLITIQAVKIIAVNVAISISLAHGGRCSLSDTGQIPLQLSHM